MNAISNNNNKKKNVCAEVFAWLVWYPKKCSLVFTAPYRVGPLDIVYHDDVLFDSSLLFHMC